MNHLGDTNKMIRATPRMDASAHDDGAIWQTGCDIERELNAANIEIERLTNKVAQLYEGAEEQKQRIKRLEEAGDAMADLLEEEMFMKLAVQWRKAKGDKL
jgi:predicted  nucleic acid-binding Zn-ribbon protein